MPVIISLESFRPSGTSRKTGDHGALARWKIKSLDREQRDPIVYNLLLYVVYLQHKLFYLRHGIQKTL